MATLKQHDGNQVGRQTCRAQGKTLAMKADHAGFTIHELVITIAIIAILGSIAIPNVIGWRERAKLRGVFENLRGDMRWARSRAIQEHDVVSVIFSNDNYQIFLDNGAGGVTRGDYVREGGEPLLRTRKLTAGVIIDLGATTIGGGQTQFDARGRCLNTGNVVMKRTNGQQRQLKINPLGIAKEP
jgi:prepilin-type N-terminal cleavage/methylation domain-containing protein